MLSYALLVNMGHGKLKWKARNVKNGETGRSNMPTEVEHQNKNA